MKTKIPYIVLAVCLLLGLGLLFYPTLSNWYNARYQLQAVVAADESIRQMTDEERARQLAKAEEYNKVLTGEGLRDPFIPGGSSQLPQDYLSILDTHDGIMGSIKIPAIGVDLPIYHGTSSKVLEKGVGHMEMTAFPIGGEGNHTVLTGHTALPSALLFTDLDKLVEGDVFTISILGDTLAYEVDQITVVEPDDTEPLLPEPGKDYVTLLTCTPYGVNSHRLLVRGERIPYTEELAQQLEQGAKGAWLRYDLVIALVALALLVAAAVVILVRRRSRDKRRERRDTYKRSYHDKQ